MPIIEEILEEFWTNNLEVLTTLDEEKLLINITIKKCQEQKRKQVEEFKKEFKKIVWDVAMEKGGSNLDYDDVINEAIDKIFKEKK